VFKERISRFGSLISLIAVTALLVIYSLSLPEFLASLPGRVFAVAWAVMAIVIFVAHARRLSGQRRRPPAMARTARTRRLPQKDERRTVRPLRS
jgi:hypothetical protein